jgi:hypothetical protein
MLPGAMRAARDGDETVDEVDLVARLAYAAF